MGRMRTVRDSPSSLTTIADTFSSEVRERIIRPEMKSRFV